VANPSVLGLPRRGWRKWKLNTGMLGADRELISELSAAATGGVTSYYSPSIKAWHDEESSIYGVYFFISHSLNAILI
jgi:hypothetical protein